MSYEIFIFGETVDLVIPNKDAIYRDGWNKWISDPQSNKYSGKGIYPVTKEQQENFLAALEAPNSDRFALLIKPKDVEKTIGVVSLSSINLHHKNADTALILSPDSSKFKGSIFFALEAKSRIVEHAFLKIGLNKVRGSQVVEYSKWQDYQLVFGFRPEGISRDGFYINQRYFNLIISSCLYEDYLKIIKERGAYWPGKIEMLREMRRLQNLNLVNRFQELVSNFHSEIDKLQGEI